MHHVLSRADVRGHFKSILPQGALLDFGWTVPTHPLCHKEMQGNADAAANYLKNLLGPLNGVAERDGFARWFHDRGYYWASALIKFDTLKRFERELDPRARDQLLERLLTSTAGIRGAQNLPYLAISGRDIQKPGVQLGLTDVKANRGHQGTAVDAYRCARVLTESARDLAPSLKRREAQVFGQLQDAQKATEMAESEYSRHTGLVLSSTAAVIEKKFDLVWEYTEALQDERKGTGSWLYKAESWFAQGVTTLETANTLAGAVSAYKLLAKAQYVAVVLGLQTTPHRDMPFAPQGHSWDWMPADVLMTAPAFSQFLRDPEDCLKLRREAIAQPKLLRDLLFPLLGYNDAPPPGAM